MGLNLTMKVAGITYEGRQAKIARLRGDEPVRIIPEPTNAYDPHALAVHVAMSDGSIAHVAYGPRYFWNEDSGNYDFPAPVMPDAARRMEAEHERQAAIRAGQLTLFDGE